MLVFEPKDHLLRKISNSKVGIVLFRGIEIALDQLFGVGVEQSLLFCKENAFLTGLRLADFLVDNLCHTLLNLFIKLVAFNMGMLAAVIHVLLSHCLSLGMTQLWFNHKCLPRTIRADNKRHVLLSLSQF